MSTAVKGSSRIYILLPVHDRKPVTEKFLRCLVSQTYTNWHLILIDDGSRDGTADMARALVPALTVLTGKGKWWWGGSLHRGYRWLREANIADDDVVLIINDDTEFGPEFLAAAVKALKPRSLLLAQPYGAETGEFLDVGVHWDWRALSCVGVLDVRAANCFSTRGLFMEWSVMREVGGFHPILLPHYFSDYEYTIRAHRLEFRFMSAPSVFLKCHETLTGRQHLTPGPLLSVLRTAFSMRCIINPIYWGAFLLLACPKAYLPRNLFFVAIRFVKDIRAAVREHSRISAQTRTTS